MVYNASQSHVGRRMKVGEGLAGRVFLSRQPLLVGDYGSWEWASEVWADVTFGTILAVPLLYGDNPVGVLTFVDNVKNRTLDDDALRVALLFASSSGCRLDQRSLSGRKPTAHRPPPGLATGHYLGHGDVESVNGLAVGG